MWSLKMFEKEQYLTVAQIKSLISRLSRTKQNLGLSGWKDINGDEVESVLCQVMLKKLGEANIF